MLRMLVVLIPFGLAGSAIAQNNTQQSGSGIEWCPFISDPTTLSDDIVSGTIASEELPRLVTDANGTWVAVWRGVFLDNFDEDLAFARSTDNGTTWSQPQPFNSTASNIVGTGDDRYPALATDGTGLWIAVWASREDPAGGDYDIVLSRSIDNGATWSDAEFLYDHVANTAYDAYTHIVTDKLGTWIIVWNSGQDIGGIGSDHDILMAKSVDNGNTWTTPSPLNVDAATDGMDDEEPWIVTDELGTYVATWWRGGIGGALVAQSSDHGETWSQVQVFDPSGNYTKVATDKSGTWVAIWEGIKVSTSTDAGITWSTPISLGDGGRPQIASDAAGRWIAAWSSSDSLGGTIGSDLDILLARSADGGLTWSSPVPLNKSATLDSWSDSEPLIANDENGSWIGAWISHKQGTDVVVASLRMRDTDCNSNSVFDGCDVQNLFSEDCNFDSLPDECQPDEDCNENLVRDICDIGDGISLDCNANLVPDDCDVATGTSQDCDGDVVPDSCEPGFGDFDWIGADGESFADPSNWDLLAPPGVGGHARLANTVNGDNRSILSDSDDLEICSLVVESSGQGIQTLELQDGSQLLAHSHVDNISGGVIKLSGGELIASTVDNSGSRIEGFGVISGQVSNGGMVAGTIGGTLKITGSGFDNSGGSLVAEFGALVHVASDAVIQDGMIELHLSSGMLFDNPLVNLDGSAITLLGGSLGIPTLTNNPAATVYGFGSIEGDVSNLGDITIVADTVLVGDLGNSGTVTVQNGILTVIGDVTGPGEIIGNQFTSQRTSMTVESSEAGLGLSIIGDFRPSAGSTLRLNYGTLRVSGDVDISINDSSRLDLSATTIHLVGLPEDGKQLLEVLADDFGPCVDLTDSLLIPIDTLRLGPPASDIRLVDQHQNSPEAGNEALYVSNLEIEEASTLDLAGLSLYYRSATPAKPLDAKSGVSVIDSVGGGRLVRIPSLAAVGNETTITPKNRYLSFVTNNPGEQSALRLQFLDLPEPFHVLNGVTMWVGEPKTTSENAGSSEPEPGFPNFQVSTLQCEPFFTDWSSVGTVSIFHQNVIPGGTYAIQEIHEVCDTGDESDFTAALGIETSLYGDIVKDCTVVPCPPPDGQLNIVDALAIVQKFVNAQGAVSKTRADIEAKTPDQTINITDVLFALNAFAGLPYPFDSMVEDPCESLRSNPFP